MPVFYNGKFINTPFKDEWEIVGPLIRERVLSKSNKAAKKDFHVLIKGETGTGKELVAHYIHRHSRRKGTNFVTINVASLPETLFESELFGHTRHAYTGATKDRMGLLVQADEGTIFFDELGDLKPHLQAALLRFIQSGEIKRIGEDQPRKIDARIIAATNKDIYREMKQGRFREDLYNRLDQLVVSTPTLREVREDIPHLLAYFTNKYERFFDGGLEKRIIPADLVRLLCEFEWEGNVRQLENSVKKFAASGDVYELIPESYYDFFRFLSHAQEKWGLGWFLSIVAYNYIAIVDRLARSNANFDRDIDDILQIDRREIDAVLKTDDHPKFKGPFNHYPNLRRSFRDYAERYAPVSYVITRFARAWIGISLEIGTEYPKKIGELSDGQQVVSKDLDFSKICGDLNTRVFQSRLEEVMAGSRELRLSEIFQGQGYKQHTQIADRPT